MMVEQNDKLNKLRLSNEESNKLTREALETAMILLLKDKDFDKISVSDIAKRAGVSRSAFYRNYENKEELVKCLCETIFNEIRKSIHKDSYKNDKVTWYTIFFTTIKNNSEYFQIYLETNLPIGDELVLNSIYPPTNSKDHYRNVAKEGAFLKILTDWFNNGMKETPSEMGQICNNILSTF